MRLEIHLPKRVAFDDYHEFDVLQGHLCHISSRLRVKEIACVNGDYVGIIYEMGTLGQPECQIMIEQIKKEAQ